MTDFYPDLSEIDVEAPSPSGSMFHPANETLPGALLHAAIPDDTLVRLQNESGFALVIIVPSPDWIDPIGDAVRGLRHWDEVIQGEATSKKRPSSVLIARKLAKGCSIVGIASAERQLPPALVAAADARITIPTPPDDVVSHAIEEATGGYPEGMPNGIAAGLDFYDVVSAIRIGSTPEACVQRLLAASRSMSVTDRALADVPRFEDMLGLGQAHDWGMRLIGDLESWRMGELAFDKIDRHVVVASDPGLGKTTLVRALAKSTRLPLFATSVASWFTAPGDGYLHAVLREAERVFTAAANSAPSIVLLDELDSLPSRLSVSDRNRDFWSPLIAQILLMLDGATSGPASKIIVIGATNHADRLDPALVRPGRLNRVITIHPPDATALAGIMRQHLGTDLPEADLAPLAELATGATGAMAMGWVRDARSNARQSGRDLELNDLLGAITPPDDRPGADLRRFALHESGHAVLCHRLNAGGVKAVSIVMRGDAAASTATRRWLGQSPTRADIESDVVCTLGGRAAEIEILGTASTGAGGSADSDLGMATRAIAALHTSYGLGQSLLHLGEPDRATDELRFDRALRDTVSKTLLKLHDDALRLVRENRAAIMAVADALLEKRHLDAKGFLAVIEASDAAKPTTASDKKGLRHG